MPSPCDFPALGRILAAGEDWVVFQPQGTRYEIRLQTAAKCEGRIDHRITCLIRLAARKVYTVSSGGRFIVPIAGPPRVVQGRITHLDDTRMVVQLAVPVIIELPKADDAYDLACGPLSVGALVNVVALPGARLEPYAPTVAT